LASMAQGKSVLKNVLFSDDSRGFLDCLTALGYDITVNEADKTVELTGGFPIRKTVINVRSAGTSARFLTAMLAAYEGEYTVEASEQMKARPMKPLMDILNSLGCKIEYLDKEGFLPFKLFCNGLSGGEVTLETGQSSQFLSALLMTGVLHKNDLKISLSGKGTAKSYVDITLKMMEQFGVSAGRTEPGSSAEPTNGKSYFVKSGQKYFSREFKIEPDVSSACYFYAAAAMTGGTALVRDVYFSSVQGDIKFLDILKNLGCTVNETGGGVLLKGPTQGRYNGIEVDMNDCSDQTMTLAAMAPFALSPTVIRNIKHIKYQESNRIQAILTELAKMGIKCGETDDGIIIYPGAPNPSVVETYEDHRMAMAFSLVGLRAGGVKISDPACTAKTFENYFEIFEGIYN